MSIGKKSIARAASAVAMAENTAEETVVVSEEVVAEAVETAEPEIKEVNVIDERFKNVSVGDAMPAFLL